MTLKGWDTRDSSAQPTFTNTKFGGGVTTIQCNPHVDNVVAVGRCSGSLQIVVYIDKGNFRIAMMRQ